MNDRFVSSSELPMPPQKPLSLKRLISGKKYDEELAKEYLHE